MWLILALVFASAGELSTYPGAVHTRIGDDHAGSPERRRLAYFWTRDPLPTVARYFAERWRLEGLPTFVSGDLRSAAVVAAFETRQGIQRAVILSAQDGRTLGFTVLEDWSLRTPGLPDQVARRPEGALVAGSLVDAREALGERLRSEGFSLTRESARTTDAGRQHLLVFRRGPDQVIAVLSQLGPDATAVLETRTAESER